MPPNNVHSTTKQPEGAAEFGKRMVLAASCENTAQAWKPVRIWIEYQVETVGYFTPVNLPDMTAAEDAEQ